MKEYHKIQSVFKRDEKTHKFIEGEWSLPEFEYLKDNVWVATEKVDGTNIRVDWDLEKVTFGGRTENAQVPTFLYNKLTSLFNVNEFRLLYPETPMTLYGEGYGKKIQKLGSSYISDGVDFVLFDVMIEGWWLKREDVEEIGKILHIRVVPIVYEGNLNDMICLVKFKDLGSVWGDFLAEGIVIKPKVELKNRAGRRIITKIKHKDF